MSVNKVILVGRLGNDPEMKSTQSGSAIANLSIATSETWNDKQGQRQERTEWHRVVFYDRLAELCGRFLSKGRQVYIEGKIQTRKWTDQQGQTRYSTEVIGREMKFLGERGASGDSAGNYNRGVGGGGGNDWGGGGRAPQQPSAPAPFQPSGDGGGFNDDDIPF